MGYNWTNIAAATAAVTDRFFASAAMANGAYAIANGGTMPTSGARRLTFIRTAVGAADTGGTIAVVGTNVLGETITETVTVGASGATVYTTKYYKKLTSATQAGWAIAEGNDTIVIGCDAAAILAEGGGVLHGAQINTTAASTIVVADSRGTIATLPANVAVGTFYLWDVNWSGYLSVTVNGASNVTLMHTPSLPASYSK